MISWVNLPIPYLNSEFFMWVDSWLADFSVAWFCIGVTLLFIMSVTELFNDQCSYGREDMFGGKLNLRQEAVLLWWCIVLWPITVYVIYINLSTIRRTLNNPSRVKHLVLDDDLDL